MAKGKGKPKATTSPMAPPQAGAGGKNIPPWMQPKAKAAAKKASKKS